MKVLVTGGAGYIGSHAVRSLARAGHQVVVVDDLSQGFERAVQVAAPEVPLVVGKISDVAVFLRAKALVDFEVVMHFAAFIEVGESVLDPAKYYQNNVASALALLDHCRHHAVKKFVFSSTAAVYGEPELSPVLETTPARPINPYGQSKWMVECALSDYARAYGMGYAILRYFNVAGAHPDGDLGEAHEPESHLIPRILAAANDPSFELKVYGDDYPTPDGTCVRDYVHVEDLVAAHALAMQKIQLGAGAVYNVGSEKGFSVREVIRVCEQVTGQKLQHQICARRAGDCAVLVANSEKLRRDLSWRPRYPDLSSIVTHAWRWHSTHPRAYRTK